MWAFSLPPLASPPPFFLESRIGKSSSAQVNHQHNDRQMRPDTHHFLHRSEIGNFEEGRKSGKNKRHRRSITRKTAVFRSVCFSSDLPTPTLQKKAPLATRRRRLGCEATQEKFSSEVNDSVAENNHLNVKSLMGGVACSYLPLKIMSAQ